MAPPWLTLQNIELSFGGDPLLNGVEASVFEGDRICLVGRNGCGKSSFLKIAAGLLEADAGERFLQPGVTLCYLEQEPDLSGYDTVGDYARAGLAGVEDAHKADYFLTELGLDPMMGTSNLSGGEGRRAALVRALAPEPDILLLDEPTNHLDLPAIEWLEDTLKSLRSAIVVISHDRRFLSNISRSVIWIDRGIARQMRQGFAQFEEWRDEVYEQEALDAHKLVRKIAMEEDWLRYGVTARRKRNQKRLSDLHSLRDQRKTYKGPRGSVKLEQNDGRLSGRRVIEAEGIAKSFGDTKIVSGLDLRIMRGDRLGIIGPNGAGKSTLIKMLTGALQPDAGEITLGSNIEMVTLDQARDSLKPHWTLSDALTNGGGDYVELGDRRKHVIGYMKDFLFDPGQARTPLDVLSGGERARVMLARALSLPSNLMVLDEPTNDLDLETLDLLEEMISSYEGTVLLVSHDRDFIDRVVGSVLVYEGPGCWVEYAGGYSGMVAQKAKLLKDAAKSQAKETANNRDINGVGVDNRDGEANSEKRSLAAQGRLTYKDKYALDNLPKQIEEIEGRISDFEAELADPELFQKNPDKFNEISQGLGELLGQKDTLEEQWLELEMKREELEG
ncbi:MAG: ATP-binding protein [Rhodomicrobium sp.]|nr:MAG: ATP-binding protein [Rhodomicrobium sp.]